MSPWEMRHHFNYLLSQADESPQLEIVRQRLDRLVAGWTAAWAEHGDGVSGLPRYHQLLFSAKRDLDRIGGHKIKLANQRSLYRVLQGFIFDNAVESDRVHSSKAAALKSQQPAAPAASPLISRTSPNGAARSARTR
jgi:hypothetical protein